jgi:uncharacterized membrane protein YfcA
MPDLIHSAAFMLAGCIAGVMNAIAGGGTLVTFPTLVFAGLPSIVANATSTVALLPAAISSAFSYRRAARSVIRWLRIFAPVSLLGGLTGGMLLVRTPSHVFDTLVPFLILFATVLFMANTTFSRIGARLSGRASQSDIQPLARNVAGSPPGGGRGNLPGESPVIATDPQRTWVMGAAAFQLAVAIYGGYFGAGIGILMLASLGLLGFGDVHAMNALKVRLGFLINVVAAMYFVWSGLVNWPSAGIMALGTIAGGYGGAHFAQKVPQSRVRSLITLIGLVISAVMFYKQFA